MLFFWDNIQHNLSVGGIDIVGLGMQPDGVTVGVAGVGLGVAVREEPRPWDGFAFGFVLSRLERCDSLFFHNASDSLLESANVAAHWEIRCKGRGIFVLSEAQNVT